MSRQHFENPRYESLLAETGRIVNELAHKVYNAHLTANEGFRQKNTEILQKAIQGLKGIEEDANHLDNNIIQIFARFDPEASELRSLVSWLKITHELVRIGKDARVYARNIKEALENNVSLEQFDNYINQLHKSTIASVKMALDSLVNTHTQDSFEYAVLQTKIEETKTDDLCSLLETEIMDTVRENKELSSVFVKILSTIRKLERTADHAVNITDLVSYAKKGGKIKSYRS